MRAAILLLGLMLGSSSLAYGHAGALDGVIGFSQQVLDLIDEFTVLIPGHGAVADDQDLPIRIDRLLTMRDRNRAQRQAGASLEQVLAASVSVGFNERCGQGRVFFDRACTRLAHDHH